MRPTIFLLTIDQSVVQIVREAAGAASPVDLAVFDVTTNALAAILDPNRFKPQMIFVDVAAMPDGARFIDFIKSSGPTRNLPIVTIVDQPNSLTAVFSQRVGGTRILEKPVTANALMETIEILRKSERRDEEILRAAQ